MRRGDAPLIVSLPHTGTDIPADIEARLVSSWLARKDADWWVDRLYDFAAELDATIDRARPLAHGHRRQSRPVRRLALSGPGDDRAVPHHHFRWRAALSRRPRSGRRGDRDRRALFFDPYHAALAGEIERLRAAVTRVVALRRPLDPLAVPRLFDGELPHFNIGTNGGASCDPAADRGGRAPSAAPPVGPASPTAASRAATSPAATGRPSDGVHAIQMELACRGYMAEPTGPADRRQLAEPLRSGRAAPMAAILAPSFRRLPRLSPRNAT